MRKTTAPLLRERGESFSFKPRFCGMLCCWHTCCGIDKSLQPPGRCCHWACKVNCCFRVGCSCCTCEQIPSDCCFSCGEESPCSCSEEICCAYDDSLYCYRCGKRDCRCPPSASCCFICCRRCNKRQIQVQFTPRLYYYIWPTEPPSGDHIGEFIECLGLSDVIFERTDDKSAASFILYLCPTERYLSDFDASRFIPTIGFLVTSINPRGDPNSHNTFYYRISTGQFYPPERRNIFIDEIRENLDALSQRGDL